MNAVATSPIGELCRVFLQAQGNADAPSSELSAVSVQGSMLEIEQATNNIEAQSRLSQLRAELGLDGGAAPAPAAVAPGSAGAISAAPADAGSVPVTEDQPAAQPGT